MLAVNAVAAMEPVTTNYIHGINDRVGGGGGDILHRRLGRVFGWARANFRNAWREWEWSWHQGQAIKGADSP
jgi:hypothetical protein